MTDITPQDILDDAKLAGATELKPYDYGASVTSVIMTYKTLVKFAELRDARLNTKLAEQKVIIEKMKVSAEYIKRLEDVAKHFDEAMAWELGGEPIPSLSIAARALYKSVLASRPVKKGKRA